MRFASTLVRQIRTITSAAEVQEHHASPRLDDLALLEAVDCDASDLAAGHELAGPARRNPVALCEPVLDTEPQGRVVRTDDEIVSFIPASPSAPRGS
jgi:hypothetical protein